MNFKPSTKTLFISFLCLLLTACGSKTSENNDVNADTVVSVDDAGVDNAPTTPTPNEEKILTIKGKDIWVRDEPGTGKVIMKLNEGDKCKVLYKQQFEIIRGQADYWYNIEFNGQQGWVFGGQTDQAGLIPPTFLASDRKDFWRKLVENEKEKCRLGIDPGISPFPSDDGPDCDCHFFLDGREQSLKAENNQVPEKTFTANYSACNVAEFKYEIIPSSFSKIAFVNNTTMIAAASVNTYRFSLFSIQDGKDFKYYKEAKLNGWVYGYLEIGKDEFCLFTYQVGNSMGTGTEYWFDVYYVNTSDITVRRVLKQIGNFQKFNFREEISTDSIEVRLKKDKKEFELVEYKVKQEGEQYTPLDTLVSVFYWDNRTKNFLKK